MTLRQLRTNIINALSTAPALTAHGVPADNIMKGKSDDNTSFPLPCLLVYVKSKKGNSAENSDFLRIAEVNIFCLVEPEIDVAESEMNSIELGEKVEKILKESAGFEWLDTGAPETDGSYPDYACSFMIFTHPFISSAS